MNENPGKAILDKVESRLRQGLKEDIAIRGMDAVHDNINKRFRLWNIAPKYLQEGTEKLSEMRQKLNTESGIVISNHPGYPDFLAILNCRKRKDIKIMVNKDEFAELQDLIGGDYLVPASHGPKLRQIIRNVERHINSGGLFLIFPSGGSQTDFQSGIVSLLDRLPAEEMVYAFHVDQKDIVEVEGLFGTRKSGATSATFVHPSTNINRLEETKLFKVDEHYTTAKEWQDFSADGIKRKDRSALLTEHYRKIFDS